MPPHFRRRLASELAQRRQHNARYSLRAFAAALGTDHSTLSQILPGQRRIPLKCLRAWARQLACLPEKIAAYVAADDLPDPAHTARENQLRHWTAEALELLRSPLHWRIFKLTASPDLQPGSRWVAGRTGANIDDVNVAFTRLLRLELLTAGAGGRWLPLATATNETAFRRPTITSAK